MKKPKSSIKAKNLSQLFKPDERASFVSIYMLSSISKVSRAKCLDDKTPNELLRNLNPCFTNKPNEKNGENPFLVQNCFN